MLGKDAVPTLQEIDDALTRYAHHHNLLDPDERLYIGVHVLEPVRLLESGTLSYRRVCLTDAMAHPGAVESLVRHAAEDLAAELHPTTKQQSARRA